MACITLHNIERIVKRNDELFETIEQNSGYFDENATSHDDVLTDIVASFEAEVEDI